MTDDARSSARGTGTGARHKRAIGRAGETRALAFLQQQGLVLVEQNYRCRHGEIDLILRDGPVLVFVEVRLRSRAHFGGAAASVGTIKQARLWRTAAHYLSREVQAPPCRFDVIAIDGDALQWLKNVLVGQ